MADKNKDQFDNGSDFDFDAISEFESDTKSNDKAPISHEDVDFGNSGGSSDDKDFSFTEKNDFADGTTEPETDFGSSDFGNFGAGDGNDFDFGGPPSPESVELASLSGNPDDDFGDFDGTETFSGADNNDFDAGNDDGQAYPVNETVDPFADDGDDDQAPQDEVAAAPAGEQSKTGIKQYAIAAAAVAVVGFIGYSAVMPMFFPEESPPVVAENTSPITSGTLAPTLPPKTTNIEPAPVQSPGVVDIASQPLTGTAPIVLPPIDIGKTNPVAPVDVAVAPVGIDAPISPTQPAPPIELQTPATQVAEAPVKVDPIEEFVGGDRGGLGSMKGGETAETAPSVAPDAFASIVSRLDDVVKRIEKIETRVAELASLPTSGEKSVAVPRQTVEAPPVSGGVLSAPLKPPIIETAVLRGVSRDIAWIATGKDVVEVRVGDTIPEAGVVESFQNYRGRWIAVTDKGIILPR